MMVLHIEAPYASFRKSYARSFAETYPLPPPATIYGMLLSLVGERFRHRHEGVRLAFAYKRIPKIATTLRKLSRFKYGIASKQSKLGNQPDFIETLCGIDLLCWVDSQNEPSKDENQTANGQNLETRILTALQTPSDVERYGLVCLGLSDDLVNDISIYQSGCDYWHRLVPSKTGTMELPAWVDHVGAAKTRWQRYHFEDKTQLTISENKIPWTESEWTQIVVPKIE